MFKKPKNTSVGVNSLKLENDFAIKCWQWITITSLLPNKLQYELSKTDDWVDAWSQQYHFTIQTDPGIEDKDDIKENLR